MSDLITEFLYAAGKGDLTLIRNLIAEGVSVNTKNHIGGTALMSACASYRSEAVEFLLQTGADVNLRTNDGRTALHAAVGSTPSQPEKQKSCVRLLIKHGAQIDIQDASGLTPLMNAAWFGCTMSALELLDAGASLKLKDLQGRTAKDMARLKNRNETLTVIMEYEKA